MPAKTETQPARLLVRLPAGLHEHLVQQARQQGVSVNTLIVALLAGRSQWSG